MPVIEDTEFQTLPCVEDDALVQKFKIEESSESEHVAIVSNCENCVIQANKIKCLRKKIYRLDNKIMELKEKTSMAGSQVSGLSSISL